MTLSFAHRILITAAIALGGILLLYGIYQYSTLGDTSALLTGLGGMGAGICFALYLRWFLGKSAMKSHSK